MLYTQLGIKRYLYIQQKSFWALGIKITSHELNLCAFLRTSLMAFIMGFLIGAIGHYSWTHMHELTQMTGALAPFLEFSLILWKLGIFLYKRRYFVALVKRIHQLSLEASTKELKILAEENSNDAWLSGFYYSSVLLAAFLALLVPLIMSAIGYIRTGEFELQPTFKASYPFEDNARSPFCFYIYFCTCSAAYLGAFVLISIESIYSWFMHNIVAHFRILQLQLENFSEKTNESDLRKWIRYHQRNLAIADDLNAIYTPIVLVQFALNSIQIGLVAYQIIQIPTLSELPFLITFLGAVIIQPILYCYGGERVERESELVALAIWDNLDWQHWSIKSRKLMHFPMMRAQRSCKLNGIFFVVNLRLFLWVVRTTASYMTLLWSMK